MSEVGDWLYSYTVWSVVHMGPGADAVSAVCCMLDILEEVRRSQDANTAWLVGYIAYFVKLIVVQCRMFCKLLLLFA